MNEKLSALMDGELPREEAHAVIKTLGADTTLREDWDALHLIGACMRGEGIDQSPANVRAKNGPNRCTDAIFARLAIEPTVLAPAAIRKPARTDNRTRIAMAMAASVVTISAVSVIALKQQGASVAPVNLAQQVAPQPLVDNSAAQAENKLRVNDYLVVHRQFANPNAFQPATLNRTRDVNRNVSRDDAGKQAVGR